MCSALPRTPGYDPNLFNVGINATMARSTHRDHQPLMTKSLAGLYPPGSTFKPAVALSALRRGRHHTGFRRQLLGLAGARNYVFHCWKKRGTATSDLHRGNRPVLDVYFYNVARRLGIDGIEAGAHKLGLGTLRTSRSSERAGVIPGPAGKERRMALPGLSQTLTPGIGQGYCLVTPGSAATMAARVASRQRGEPAHRPRGGKEV